MTKTPLSHLTEEQINEVMKRYYTNDKISAILKDFSIDVSPSSLYRHFPPIIHSEYTCPYCENSIFESTRQSKTASWYKSLPACSLCGHKNDARCRCLNCRKHEEKLIKAMEWHKREVVYRCFDHPSPDNVSVPADLLPLKDAVYLLSLVTHSASEDLYSVDPFSNRKPELAPTYNYQNEIVKYLHARHFIDIDPESDLGAFEFNEDITNVKAYYPTRVIWRLLPALNIQDKQTYLRHIRKMVVEGDCPDNWTEAFPIQWREIAKNECIELYYQLLTERKYDLPEIGEKTHLVFDALLDNFSTSQSFSLIWQSVRDTTDYLTKESMPRYRAKNMFVGGIQRKMDKFIAENWEPHKARRDRNCPQTVISSTFFDLFMGLGDAGFNEQPKQMTKRSA